MKPSENLYEVIDLRGGEKGLKLSVREIEQAYRMKARELHPDKNLDDPEATIKFQRLQSAFEVLKDKTRCQEHDACLRAELERERNCCKIYEEFEVDWWRHKQEAAARRQEWITMDVEEKAKAEEKLRHLVNHYTCTCEVLRQIIANERRQQGRASSAQPCHP